MGALRQIIARAAKRPSNFLVGSLPSLCVGDLVRVRHACKIAAGGVAFASIPALAQTQRTDTLRIEEPAHSEIVVTARKRQESLLNVPVAITAVSGSTLTARNLQSIKDVAQLAPGLNISSDGVGRVFIAIRGVGVTTVTSVQPGVGLFIDGVYRQNTAYLNNPLVDVERIEVLRGPQGTLYGKNTLGGAINVITRAPTDELHASISSSYAGPDDAWTTAGSISGPIVPGQITARLAYSHRQHEGFQYDLNTKAPTNALNTDALSATVRIAPGAGDAVLTLNGYYDWTVGVNRPYSQVLGPTDYRFGTQFNASNKAFYRYRGVNAKLETPIDAVSGSLTFIGSYDLRDGNLPDIDNDFSPSDLIRTTSTDQLRTESLEMRLDSKWSDRISALFGLFYSHETAASNTIDNIKINGSVRTTRARNSGDTYAAFSTIFLKINADWEASAGLRYDHEDRVARGSVMTQRSTGVSGGPLPPANIKTDQIEPRVSLTRHWTDELMTYATVARGYRGGGFNAPTAPTRSYKGDSAWTYELGSRLLSRDARFALSGAFFYSDYRDYIGLSSVAPAAGGGLVTVDLNTGNVDSYGFELEGTFRPTGRWTIRASTTLTHARITDDTQYRETTARTLSSDRITFQPDWAFDARADYALPIQSNQIVFSAGVTGKGSRLAATLNQTTPTILTSYYLVDASVTLRRGPLDLTIFATNLLQEHYVESYIEKTTPQIAGLPVSDYSLAGDGRRVGVRASLTF
ncbi:iron complex outermembrane recepter protein [Sphingobium sp. AP50]|uniref:TonB-dependent receptor n=1 Tax=Sphingobium sp. AP50 TaxID=1884369 RepID=UPI0008D054F8|nr:TonB-dependent receptor [Sphingobium sp. AP50]SEJ80395.1 iron complex outermembrane recepter protein [Sphingobium sp. AP50]